jgi:hypothetical protein
MNRLYPIEWGLCALWTLVWGSLAYIALTEGHVTLGGGRASLRFATFEGQHATFVGLALLGVAMVGIGWLLRTSRYRQLLRALLFLLWLAFCAFWIIQL